MPPPYGPPDDPTYAAFITTLQQHELPLFGHLRSPADMQTGQSVDPPLPPLGTDLEAWWSWHDGIDYNVPYDNDQPYTFFFWRLPGLRDAVALRDWWWEQSRAGSPDDPTATWRPEWLPVLVAQDSMVFANLLANPGDRDRIMRLDRETPADEAQVLAPDFQTVVARLTDRFERGVISWNSHKQEWVDHGLGDRRIEDA